jgi:hypothetical protein
MSPEILSVAMKRDAQVSYVYLLLNITLIFLLLFRMPTTSNSVLELEWVGAKAPVVSSACPGRRRR